MKRTVPVFAALSVGCFALAGCIQIGDSITAPSQSVVIHAPGSPAPSPSPSVTPGCAAMDKLRASATPDAIKVGGESQLDATPLDGVGKQLPEACHPPEAEWRVVNGACSLVGNVRGFTPRLRGDGPGSCAVSVRVGAFGAGAEVTVTR